MKDLSDLTNIDTWVMIPAFNEGTVIRPVLDELLAVFPNVVVVDDGSRDNTAQEVGQTSARLVQHPMNLGAGAARQTALEFALYDTKAKYFLTFDADGQHRVEDANAMVSYMRTNDDDIVLGSRFMGADAVGMSKQKRWLLKLARVFERMQSGVNLTDSHNGLRLFRRNFAATIQLVSSDMSYASELLGLIGASGLKFCEFPVIVNYTDYSIKKGQRSINSVNIATDVVFDRILRRSAK